MKLRELQEWMHSAVCADEFHGSPEVLKSTPGMPAARRLNVYRDMYHVRMVESLRADYGLLDCLLGEEAFEALTRRYVARFPSTSFTLNHLGNHFEKFVRADKTLPAFAADVSRFEFAIVRVFDAPEATALGIDELKKLSLHDLCERCMRPVPSFVGESFEYDVHSLYGKYLAEEMECGEEPEKHPNRVLFFRESYQVKRSRVDEIGWVLFQGLKTQPTVGEALDPALALATTPEAQQSLLQSFNEWAARGLLQYV